MAAAPELGPGEQIELAVAVQLGKASVKRQVTTAAIVAVASAGTLMVAVKRFSWGRAQTGMARRVAMALAA